MTNGRESDFQSQKGDGALSERARAPEALALTLPSSAVEGSNWNKEYKEACASFKTDSTDKILPGLTLVAGADNLGAEKSGSDTSSGKLTGDQESNLATVAGASKKDAEVDEHHDYNVSNHAGDDTEADTGVTAIVANNLSYQYHARIDQTNSERKEQTEPTEKEKVELVEDQPFPKDAADLMIRALAGDVMAGTMPPPAGFDQVSIYDLKVRKEVDGQVLLIAPGSDGKNSDGIAMLREDGRPVTAMELGKYLRPDGTIVMGERGKVLTSSDVLKFTSIYKEENRTNDVQTMEKFSVAQTRDPNQLVHSDHGQDLDMKPVFQGDNLVIDSDHLAGLLDNVGELKPDFDNTHSEPVIADKKIASAHQATAEARESVGNNDQARELSFAPREDVNEHRDEANELREEGNEHREIRARLGETPRSIALRDLHNVKLWPLLLSLNNMTTATDSRGAPLAVLQKGQTLILPTVAEIADYQARASQAVAEALT